MAVVVEERQNIFRFLPSVRYSNPEKNSEPQIGFKLNYTENRKELGVLVVGVKSLPQLCANKKPVGFQIKVRLFPAREKHETPRFKDSWTVINKEFKFKLQNIRSSPPHDPLKGKFVSLTLYADFEDNSRDRTLSRTKSTLRRILSFNDYDTAEKTFGSSANRKTLGAITYNLDDKLFTEKLGNDVVSTREIWRSVKEINSGFITQPREGVKGNVEVTLQYSISENRNNDVVEISVTKFRCGLQTMHEHEQLGGKLYIKITAFDEFDDLIQKMKSDRFEPTISLKIEQQTLRANVNTHNLAQLKILIRLFCKTAMGKKILLGRIEIDKNTDIWKRIVESPSVPITQIMNLE